MFRRISQRLAFVAVLFALCMLPLSALETKGHRRIIQHRQPPVISYVGGKHPHVTVAFVLGKYPPNVFRRETPRGLVTVRWREDDGTEDGSPAVPGPAEPDISHPDTIYHIVIVSPTHLPVYFRGAGDAKWVHVNGYRLPAVRPSDYVNGYPADPFEMDGGLNIVVVAYPDAE